MGKGMTLRGCRWSCLYPASAARYYVGKLDAKFTKFEFASVKRFEIQIFESKESFHSIIGPQKLGAIVVSFLDVDLSRKNTDGPLNGERMAN